MINQADKTGAIGENMAYFKQIHSKLNHILRQKFIFSICILSSLLIGIPYAENALADELNADFSISPRLIRVGTPVTFTATVPITPAFYYWAFSDGVTGFGPPILVRTFSNPGGYSVTLTIYDALTFDSATSSRQFIVSSGSNYPSEAPLFLEDSEIQPSIHLPTADFTR